MLMYAPPPPLTKWCIVPRNAARLVMLLVKLQVMRVTGHDHLDLMFPQELVNGGKERFAGTRRFRNDVRRTLLGHPLPRVRFRSSALVPASRVQGVPQNGQGELPAGSLEGALEPSPLIGIYSTQNAGIDGD